MTEKNVEGMVRGHSYREVNKGTSTCKHKQFRSFEASQPKLSAIMIMLNKSRGAMEHIRKGFLRKNAVLFDFFLQISTPPPSPPFGQIVQPFSEI